jgi:hypothetical protein
MAGGRSFKVFGFLPKMNRALAEKLRHISIIKSRYIHTLAL